MIEPESHDRLRRQIAERITADRAVLDALRAEIRPLRGDVRRIRSCSATAISLVATDGGNNFLRFDPFLVQLVRVVDSSNNEYCLEAITPTTSIAELSRSQFRPDGSALTPLGEMMRDLQVTSLPRLSHMIRTKDDGSPTSPSWIQVYRELMEWAILYTLVKTKDFGTDTLVVFDGLLRSKVFAGELFKEYVKALEAAIESQWRKSRRRIHVVGVAKHSKVLSRYRLAMAMEQVLTTDFAAYVEVPRDIEEKAYVWSEYARGDDRELEGAEVNKFVAGKMFLVKFGNGSRDPVWPVDILLSQKGDADTILGYLLADAVGGFPVPHYPRCLQRAHENAALVDFDFDVLQDEVFGGVRAVLGVEAPVLDAFRLQDADPAQARYA